MLASAAWTLWHWLPQQQALSDELGSQSRRLRHELQAKLDAHARPLQVVAGAKHVDSPQAAWQALWQAMPDAQQRLPLQAGLLDSAHKQGLLISAVQYRGAPEPGAQQAGQTIWRQRMSMPIEGSYPALRAWLALQLQNPAMAIDALDIQRDDASSERVKARIELSLYWREPTEPQS
jgi:hypothetical protein